MDYIKGLLPSRRRISEATADSAGLNSSWRGTADAKEKGKEISGPIYSKSGFAFIAFDFRTSFISHPQCVSLVSSLMVMLMSTVSTYVHKRAYVHSRACLGVHGFIEET